MSKRNNESQQLGITAWIDAKMECIYRRKRKERVEATGCS